MRMQYVTIVGAFTLVIAAAPAAGQAFCFPSDSSEVDEGDIAACTAATMTPFGALPTNLPASWLGRTSTGLGFNVRFGSVDEEGDTGRRNFGVGLDIPVGRATVGVTGGFVDFTCDPGGEDVECKSAIMVGGRFAMPLIMTPVGGGGAGQSSFIMGLNTSVGFATGDVLEANFFGETLEVGGRGISVGVAFPVGLVARSGTITITPFLEPAFVWGQTKFDFNTSFGNDETTESGTAFALGGGLSFGFANGVSLDLGFKKVMLDQANAMIGLGLSFQR